MEIKEFYEKYNNDYDGVMGRLMTEARVLKYLKKIEPQGDYAAAKAAVAAQDWETAFRASHSLKGVCLNLGLTTLAVPASALCENLRGGAPKEDCEPLLAALTEEYAKEIADIDLL